MVVAEWDSEQWLRLVERHRVTHAHLAPVLLGRLDPGVRLAYDVSSLRCVTHGGAPCPTELKRRMIEWFGPVLFEFYSASEGVPDQEWGQAVVAVVVPRDPAAGGPGLAGEIVAHCRERLAGFKCPKRIVFRPELPYSSSGKILRRELRQSLQETA